MDKVAKYDEEIRGLFDRIKTFGKGKQPENIEETAQKLALVAVNCCLKDRKIPLPVFYTHLEEAETLGGWYKHIRDEVPNEYGIGTREQHSYFQSLFEGKDVTLPILVDVVMPLDKVINSQQPINFMGLAGKYLQGLYPDEVRRLFLEAEFEAFISSSEEIKNKVTEEIWKKLNRTGRGRGKVRRKTKYTGVLAYASI